MLSREPDRPVAAIATVTPRAIRLAGPDDNVAADCPTDADLIDTAFAALFDRHAVAVHRYLARRIGPAIADDLVAQTFLIAFERRAGYDRARPDARPWLYGIATNLLRRHHRNEVKQYEAWARSGVDPTARPVLDMADRIAERADARAQAPRLAAALAELTDPDRDVLLLFAWSGLS
jgi:RNA polymerase sigma-70 factor, ECF subfamily